MSAIADGEDKVVEEVRSLLHMDLDRLRGEWRRRIGAPPKLRSTELLRLLLAWRLQAEAYGGLDRQTLKALQATSTPRHRRSEPPVGARLTREWKGRTHSVERIENGYLYEGKVLVSLSEAARAITGVRWNGPRFFGLRDQQGSRT